MSTFVAWQVVRSSSWWKKSNKAKIQNLLLKVDLRSTFNLHSTFPNNFFNLQQMFLLHDKLHDNYGITYHLILEVHYFYHLLRKHLRRIFLEKHFLKYFNCLHHVYNFSLDIKASFLCYSYNFN